MSDKPEVTPLRSIPAPDLVGILEDLLDLLDIEVVRYRGYGGDEYTVRRRSEETTT